MIDFGLSLDRCALLARMGMGKTPAVLGVIDARMFAGTVSKTIVLAPLRVARSTWPEEAAKWAQFAGLRVRFIEWTPPERAFLREIRKADALEARGDEHSKLAARLLVQEANRTLRRPAAQARLKVIQGLDVLCVNYDILPQLVEVLGDQWPFDMGVADECFVSGTLVSTPQGPKQIQSLAAGDTVLTSEGPRRVTHVHRKTTEALIRLHLSNGTEVVCTPDHLFWSEGMWRPAKHLCGRTLVCASELRPGSIRVDRVEDFEHRGPTEVWDLEVEGAHNYFANGVLVHNCTRVKSFRLRQGGKRAQALAKVAHTLTRFWINLTGTFAPNGLGDLWGPMWFIDRGARLGRSYDDFESRWFGFQRIKDAVGKGGFVKRIVFPHAQAEIIGRIKDVALAFNPRDWFSIKEPVVVPVYVSLPATARKKYKEMERDLFTHIEGHDIEAFAASAKMIKLQQLANGAAYTGSDIEIEGDTAHWVEAHDEKLDALESIIEEAGGEPMLVAYHFRPDLARLKKRFPQGRHIDTKKDEDDFKAGRFTLAFVHPQSIGHGVDGFQNVCHIIVFFALSFDLETHDQIIERIGPMRQEQAGFDREVMVYQILARDTIDETVAARLIEKRHVQDATMDSLAHKPERL